MAIDYTEKQFLDKEGLKKVFELIREEYSSMDEINENIIAMDDSLIQKLYCTSCGCVTDEVPSGDIDGKIINITWGNDDDPVEIEEASDNSLQNVQVEVNDEPKELDNAEIVESTTLQLTLKEEVTEGSVKVLIPKGTIRIVETGEVNNDEVFEYEIVVAALPNNEIWYKTSDNQPITLDTTEGFGAEFISNEYDETDGYCKIKFDGDVTAIPGSTSSDGFMYFGTKLTEIYHLPSTIESIGRDFLSYCRGLQSLDLSGLNNIKSIGNYFLNQCTGITSVNLSGLNNIESIGDNFLISCSGLQSLDLSGLTKVTSIGSAFLRSCSGLQSLDLSPLTGVTSIESSFLFSCSGLISVNLSGLSNVESIGHSFLSYCSDLQTLDLSPLSKVTSIGSAFLSGCLKLKTFIIDHPEGLITLPLATPNLSITPDEIYVNDELLTQYQQEVSKFADKFKPLSEYQK